MMVLRDAVAAVAMSHGEGHDCHVCRAAQGDEAAFAEVLAEMQAGRG